MTDSRPPASVRGEMSASARSEKPKPTAGALAQGTRVRVHTSAGVTVIGRLLGTVVGDEPGMPGHYRVRTDGPVAVKNGRRVRLPGRILAASRADLELI